MYMYIHVSVVLYVIVYVCIIWYITCIMYPYSHYIGSGSTSVVQEARYIPKDQRVAIKRINLEQCGATIEELQVCLRPVHYIHVHVFMCYSALNV